MYKEGVYRVRATSWEFVVTSRKECPQFRMDFAVFAKFPDQDLDAEPEPCDPGNRSWSISIPEDDEETTSRNVEWLLSTVQHLGYDGDGLLGLNPDEAGAFNFEGVEFIASCKHEEHEGRTREKWAVYRPPTKTLARDRLLALDAKFGHKAKELKERRAAKETGTTAGEKSPRSTKASRTSDDAGQRRQGHLLIGTEGKMMEHLKRFLARLEGVRVASSGYKACCPCPDHGGGGKGDGDPSLSVSLGDDDRILCHCFGGCPLDAILEATGLDHTDLWPGAGDIEDDDAVARADGSGKAIHRDGRLERRVPRHRPDRIWSTKRLLTELTLTESHRRQLRDRGLTDERIDHAGYRSLGFFEFRQHAVASLRDEFGEELLKVPGFVRKADRVSAVTLPNGLLIPVRDTAGSVIALKVRPDEAGRGGKYLWFSGGDGPSCGSPVHVPRGVTPAKLVRVTEGPLKADVAFALSALPTVAVPGVTNWAPAVPLLKGWGVAVARLAFDADACVKMNVARQQLDFAEALVREGIRVELERWPLEAGKGIDDLLVVGGTPEVLDGDDAMRGDPGTGRGRSG